MMLQQAANGAKDVSLSQSARLYAEQFIEWSSLNLHFYYKETTSVAVWGDRVTGRNGSLEISLSNQQLVESALVSDQFSYVLQYLNEFG